MVSRQLDEWIRSGHPRLLAGYRVFTRTATGRGGPPLLLIHGYPTASFDWHALWPALESSYSLYTLDLLGFGLSDKPADSSYPIALQADLCQALLGAHDVRDVHVLAHDYGDTVAQELLAREREGALRLASVCFLNGGLFPETHRPRPIQRLLARPVLGRWLAARMGYSSFAAAMRSVWGRTPLDDAELRDLWWLVERNDGRAALARLINYMEQRRRQRDRWVGALVHSAVPRRLICGLLDPVSGAHLARRYRELVPDPDVFELPETGHYPQLESPQATLAAYLEFRAALSARAGSGARTARNPPASHSP